MNYFLRNAIAFDQQLNTLRGGEPDETLSAWAHRMHVAGNSRLRNVINALFFWQEDHCLQAYQSEVNRKHLPREYQK